ncbi:MAG: DUF3310 domain-containing protein [Burkholderiaceae bacterium]|nr:DUF3310 domain-containing protein [Burkholderiaceae bacterium]
MRRPDTVRYWTGKYWTRSTSTVEISQGSPTPDATWLSDKDDRIEWLEPFVHLGDRWVWWGGAVAGGPLKAHVVVQARQRDGQTHEAPAGRLAWTHLGDEADIVAYRVGVPVPAANALDRQAGGTHYKGKAIQPVEYIHANNLDFFEGNVVKYVTRWRDKGGVADLEKAKHYIEMLIELESRKN